MEWRLPPPLDKRAVGEGSYTSCRGEETIIHRENGVVDEEEWDEGNGWQLLSQMKVVAGHWPVKHRERNGCGLLRLELRQSRSVRIKRILLFHFGFS